MPKKSKNTKTRIVSAAWELFYAQGYDDTTVDDIVEASGTSKGSFYHYFDSKDALLGSLAYLFDEKYEELKDTLDASMHSFDVLLYLNRELFRLIDSGIDQTLIARLYSTQLNTRTEKSLSDNDRFYFRFLRKIVSDGQTKGELTDTMSVNDIVRMYAMCERAMIYEWCLNNWSFSLEQYASHMLPLLLQGIRKN